MNNIFIPGNIVMTTLSGYLIRVDKDSNVDSFMGTIVGKEVIDKPQSTEKYTIGHYSKGWRKDVCVLYKSIFKIKVL